MHNMKAENFLEAEREYRVARTMGGYKLSTMIAMYKNAIMKPAILHAT